MPPILWTIPLLLVTAQSSTSSPDRTAAAVLRPADPALSALVNAGMAGSETFRGRVTSIQALRGLVYIGWTPKLRSGLGAALQHHVTLTPDGIRCLWIVIRQGSRPNLVAVIGHELQHAVEVLESDAITSKDIESLFRRLDDRRVGPPFETRRAQAVEQLILNELEAASKGQVRPSAVRARRE